jgi:hypothetical protein
MEDITLTVGMSSSPAFWDWVKATFDKRLPERRNGAIVVYDYKHRERQRRTFFNALISEIGFPALDAGSKTAATLTVKISPERIKWEDGDLSHGSASYGQNEMQKQKMWLCNNFVFSLDRFKGDEELRHSKVEAFSVKQSIMQAPIGRMLETHKYGGGLETPGLQVSFNQSLVKPWIEWYDKCVRRGNYIGELTNGSITYYAPDGTTVLMTLNLYNVGLTSLEFDKLESHKEGIAKVKASLYVEAMQLQTGSGTT